MDFMDWLPWLGGGSTLALILLALFAPSVLQVASAWFVALSPLIKGVAEGLVEYAKALWFGFMDMADNAKSLIFVGSLVIAAFIFGSFYASTPQCPVCDSRPECPIPLPGRPSDNGPRNWINDVFPGLF